MKKTAFSCFHAFNMELSIIYVLLLIIMHGCPTVANEDVIEVSENTPKGSIIFTISEPYNPPCEIANKSVTRDYLIFEGRNLTITKTFNLEADKLCNNQYSELHYECSGLKDTKFIKIQAVDDFPPEFKQTSYSVEIQENNKEGADIYDFHNEVEDLDCEQERFTFEIKNSSDSYYFSIANTGKVTAKYSMDFESGKNFFNLTIIAYNDDSQSGANVGNATTILSIRLKDVDDMNPAFRFPNHTVYIQEQNNSLTGKWLQTSPPVYAYDQDIELNEPLRYLFIETVEYFEINNETGMIRVNTVLDREIQPTFRYRIKAEQVSSSQRSAESEIIINVVDINDNCAVFETSPKTLLIPENLPMGMHVYSVYARDIDEGENAMFNYTIEGEVFHIDPRSGKITVKNSTALDRETVDMFIVNISTIQWLPAVKSCDEYLELNITLLDVNDNSPVFTKTRYSFTSKNETLPQVIGKVSATDEDIAENQRVTYNIDGSASGYFEISQDGGEITHQRQSSLPVTFAVKACDNPRIHSNRRCAVVMVDVFNHDNSTVEGYDIQATIEENRKAGSIVEEISFISNQYTFQLEENTHFELERNLLKTRKVLDRETKEHYALRLIANNGTMDTDSYNINITVVDINDNPPLFTEEHYTFKLPDNVHVGSVLGTVKATDKDVGINAHVSYFVEGNRASEFSVNSSTGQITVTRLPDVSQENQFLYLNIRATDRGTPSLQSFTEVQIVVGDGNGTVAIPAGASKERIEEEKSFLEKSLSTILKMNVEIETVSVYGDGSIIHISATNMTDNSVISINYLNRKVNENMAEIQALFYQKQEKTEPKDFSDESIALMCVAGAVFLGSLFLVAFVFKKHKKYQRFKSLVSSLSRKNSIYETQETSIIIEDDLSDYTKPKSLLTEQLIQNEVIANGHTVGVINQAFVNDVEPIVTLEESHGSDSACDDNTTSHKSVEDRCLDTEEKQQQSTSIPDLQYDNIAHLYANIAQSNTSDIADSESPLAKDSSTSSEDIRSENIASDDSNYPIPPAPPLPPVTSSPTVGPHTTAINISNRDSLSTDNASKPIKSSQNPQYENVLRELHSTVVKVNSHDESDETVDIDKADDKAVDSGLKFENEDDAVYDRVDTSENEPESRVTHPPDEPEPDYAKRVRFSESHDDNVDTKSSDIPNEPTEDANMQMGEGWQSEEIHSPDSTVSGEVGTFAFGESEMTEL